MILTESIKGLENTAAKDFSLPAADGKTYSLANFAKQKVLVVIFMCNHCPYVKAVLPRLNALAKEFEKKGVGFVGINANDSTDYPEDSFEMMKEIDIAFPYLHDESQEVATAYKAVCTPDIFVYDAERKLAYHGRIDDNWKDAAAVKQQDLKNALEKILAGEKIPKENQIPAMGCSIKWK
ncbi:MAG: thioredoxin family protein [Candidatus Gracilibacteria bacterium]|nr:thioredoxin family protein [Candidatus Gracilibacteria bacterium]MDD5179273.1 thioredoxin family protein [Candidatus Gracilibacteria bacterium]